MDDRNASNFCYISVVRISVGQFFSDEEILLSYQIFNDTFKMAVVGVNDNNCSYVYFSRTYGIIV